MMSFETLKRTRWLLGAAGMAAAAVAAAALVAVAGASGAGKTKTAAATTVLASFDTPGTFSWTVPTGVRKVIFDVYGAAGGDFVEGSFVTHFGGAGGEARGTLPVKRGQTFLIVVGGRGGDASATFGGAGGFNGGGLGAPASDFPSRSGGAGGGGGSDVRVGGVGNPCASDRSCGYPDRIIVGGGGGGATSGRDGGAGGGLEGAPTEGADGSSGGTQLHGGEGSSSSEFDGSFGVGGDCEVKREDGSRTTLLGGGGGGGGWYGGACDNDPSSPAGGGGGSGYVSRFARQGSFPGLTGGGNGLVVISTP